MSVDREIEAMSAFVAQFESLDEDARRRVFRWFTERYSRYWPVSESGSEPIVADQLEAEPHTSIRGKRVADLEDMYASVGPHAQWERVLVAGYWLQEIKGLEDFDATAVTHAMRHGGYSVSNISRELTKLRGWKLIVIQQSGEGGQAGRRRFRVSRDGLRWVKKRLVEPEV